MDQKKWQVNLKEWEQLLASDKVESGQEFLGLSICVGLLAIAERLEVIAVQAVKVNRPLLHLEPEMKIGGTDPD